MGLQQDIVVVNEFTVPQPGGRGSRGGTPGAYVTQYMARPNAVEPVAPIQKFQAEAFIVRYMAREQAIERPGATRSQAKQEMQRAVGLGGVAFGYGSVSLSDEQLRVASQNIQDLFDSGKTVMKTVLSFSEEYLKRHGLVPPDFEMRGRGSYRGHLDQMKLRMAIMRGLERMARGTSGFDDLRYVATIQVDTEHVHCHLAMVDAGHGRLHQEGEQAGKLPAGNISRLRRGIDAWLDQQQLVAHLSSAVGYERRNVSTFIKRWAYDRIKTESLPQFLLACLPEDRTLWRANSNDQRMRKGNQLVHELVEERLQRSDSPLPGALAQVLEYANRRLEQEGLSTAEWQRLVDQGRRQIIERAVNGVYQLLRNLDQEELRIRTPMLEVMGMDYDQLAITAAQEQQSDLVSFGFRLRSYSSRLRHHTAKSSSYRDLVRQWDRAAEAGVAAADSKSLREFYAFEQEYHQKVMSKYQHFLPFSTSGERWQGELEEVQQYGDRLRDLGALRNDASLQRMKDPDRAEAMGREVYGQSGGRHLTDGARGRAVLDARLRVMRRSYDERVQALKSELTSAGLSLQLETKAPVAGDVSEVPIQRPKQIVQSPPHPFSEVKGLDLHHLGYDFVQDVRIGPSARDAFIQAAQRRRQHLVAAMDYLDQTGQSAAISDLPVDDVANMMKLARELGAQRSVGDVVLASRIARLRDEQHHVASVRRSRTTSLDAGLVVRVQREIDASVRAQQPDPEQGEMAESAGL